uniref:TIR domain-containing protein n=1 Tax=Kalanchoe fedtschenkoi TaxID=63787 RepID=A0A7N0REH6_KALFE
MPRSYASLSKGLIHRPRRGKPCDVFINHRGIDTKRSVAGLLWSHLRVTAGLNPFLDSKSMRPGDRLYDEINTAINESKLGVAVFSRRYCESYFCMHELTLMMQARKRLLPIFVDVKPSELRVCRTVEEACSGEEVKVFNWALKEARHIVGLTFDSSSMDWSSFLRKASDAVVKNLMEVEREN